MKFQGLANLKSKNGYAKVQGRRLNKFTRDLEARNFDFCYLDIKIDGKRSAGHYEDKEDVIGLLKRMQLERS